jgi:hypothetical protein
MKRALLVGFLIWAFFNGLRLMVERAHVSGVEGFQIGFITASVFCTLVVLYVRWAVWRSLSPDRPSFWEGIIPPASPRDRA